MLFDDRYVSNRAVMGLNSEAHFINELLRFFMPLRWHKKRPSVRLSIVLVNTISQERFEGFSSNFAQMFTVTQG